MEKKVVLISSVTFCRRWKQRGEWEEGKGRREGEKDKKKGQVSREVRRETRKRLLKQPFQ